MIMICPYCKSTPSVVCTVCGAPVKQKQASIGLAKKMIYKVSLPFISKAPTWEVEGVDLSAWNGNMDLSVTKSKTKYAFFRLGYGEQWKDARCDTYRRDALAIDYPYGVYWFCYPQYSWIKHADSFAKISEEFPFQLDMIIDAETTNLDRQQTLDWFMNLDGRLRSLTGKVPIVYTSKGFWDAKVAQSNYFKQRRNHIAHWTTAPAPLTPRDMPIWGHWQWSADGNRKAKEYGMVSGGDFDIDLNRYYGTAIEFDAQYGTHISSTPPPVVPPIPPNIEPIAPVKFVYINAQELNMRSLPDATSRDIGSLHYDDDVPVVEEKDDWYKVVGWINKNYTRPK